MDSAVLSSNREIEMADITTLSVYDVQERMGSEATKADAECMLAILSRECVTDTDDVSEAQWLKWCEEAAARAANETGA